LGERSFAVAGKGSQRRTIWAAAPGLARTGWQCQLKNTTIALDWIDR